MCSDFLSILNLTLEDLEVTDEVFANVSLPLSDYVKMFLQNRTGRKLLQDEVRCINNLVSQEAGKIGLSAGLRLDLFQRFRETNRNLFIQYGITEPTIEDTCGVEDYLQKPYIDMLFNENIESFLSEPLEKQAIARGQGF
jgi:hypothetical protein